jgi:hypothetical protein
MLPCRSNRPIKENTTFIIVMMRRARAANVLNEAAAERGLIMKGTITHKKRETQPKHQQQHNLRPTTNPREALCRNY